MNSYEKLYNILIEGQTDWSQEGETDSFEGIPERKGDRGPFKRPKSTKHRRIKPASSRGTLQTIKDALKKDIAIRQRKHTK